jgi:hypothetical protein
VIVIVGNPGWRARDPVGPAGRTCEIALAAAARGSGVEIVGRAGDDRDGDALMVALAKGGVGHVAVLRDAAHPTGIDADAPVLEPADVSLGLQYLTTYHVLVVADDVPDAVVPVAMEAAGFAGAHLVLLVPVGPAGAVRATPAAADATVLAAPKGDDDGAFARLVGVYAAEVDGGTDPAAAFAAAVASAGWEALEPLA